MTNICMVSFIKLVTICQYANNFYMRRIDFFKATAASFENKCEPFHLQHSNVTIAMWLTPESVYDAPEL